MNNLEELKNAAMKATPGPWFGMDEDWSDGENIQITCESREGVIEIAKVEGGGSESGFSDPFKSEQQANAIFIALANPSALLDLIAQLEAAQKERDEFRRRLKLERSILEDTDKQLAELKAELSAANEKLSKPVALPLKSSDAALSPKLYPNFANYGLGYNDAIDECAKAIKAAGFTVEGE